MRTLVIVSHPEISQSGSQQFLKHGIKDFEEVTFHHLEGCYPDGKINREIEHQLLKTHDRIIFQFPFYWYSSPALLKEWQDQVFAGDNFYGPEGSMLKGKEFGLVVTIGIKENAYRAGGREGYTIDELTRPYQAIANHMGMSYLPVLAIHQFAYLSEHEKKALLINYQYYLTGKQPDSFDNRTNWLVNQLERTDRSLLPEEKHESLETLVSEVAARQMTLTELKMTLDEC